MDPLAFLVVLLSGLLCGDALTIGQYDPKLGTYIGKLSTLWHDVTGDVFSVDDTTIYIRGFSYDGEAPDAFFFAGNRTPEPSNRGFIIPDEKGESYPLGVYRNKDLLLKFPITKKGQRSFHDVKWISVWCRQFAIDFGHVKMPKNVQIPSRLETNGLQSDKPLVTSSSVVVNDANTILLPDFTYDGAVEDAIFVMGSGDENASGIQVPDEKGTMKPLRKYNRKALKLTIPKDARGQPVQYFGVWSPSIGMLTSSTFPADSLVPPHVSSLP